MIDRTNIAVPSWPVPVGGNDVELNVKGARRMTGDRYQRAKIALIRIACLACIVSRLANIEATLPHMVMRVLLAEEAWMVEEFSFALDEWADVRRLLEQAALMIDEMEA